MIIRPKARFLTQEEKDALNKQLESERQKTETSSAISALKNAKVWHLALIYGTIQISVYGLMFFLPSQVASLMGESLGFKQSLVSNARGRALLLVSITFRELLTAILPGVWPFRLCVC